MTKFSALEERYANMTFETGTMVEPSKPTIDAGRVLTLERRQRISRMHARVRSQYGSYDIEIPNRALLSPRRIARLGFGQDAADIADGIHLAMSHQLVRKPQSGGTFLLHKYWRIALIEERD